MACVNDQIEEGRQPVPASFAGLIRKAPHSASRHAGFSHARVDTLKVKTASERPPIPGAVP